MATLKDLKLYKENDKYYLSALLIHEDKRGIYEVSIPKIELPIASDCSIDYTYGACGYFPNTTLTVDFGFGKLYAVPVDDDNKLYFTLTCIEEKVRKMTLAEIERELGYKIELKEN